VQIVKEIRIDCDKDTILLLWNRSAGLPAIRAIEAVFLEKSKTGLLK
jgi:phosphoribosyl-AMP cyclohydrolase